MALQAHTLLEHLVITFDLFLVGVDVLRGVAGATIHLSDGHVALTVPAANDVLLGGRLLLKLLLRLLVHI